MARCDEATHGSHFSRCLFAKRSECVRSRYRGSKMANNRKKANLPIFIVLQRQARAHTLNSFRNSIAAFYNMRDQFIYFIECAMRSLATVRRQMIGDRLRSETEWKMLRWNAVAAATAASTERAPVRSRRAQNSWKCIQGIRWAQLDKSNAFLSLVYMRDANRLVATKLHKLNREQYCARSIAQRPRTPRADTQFIIIILIKNKRVEGVRFICCMDQMLRDCITF